MYYGTYRIEETIERENLKKDEGLVILKFMNYNIPLFETKIKTNDAATFPEDGHPLKLRPKPILTNISSRFLPIHHDEISDNVVFMTKKYRIKPDKYYHFRPEQEYTICPQGYPIKVKLNKEYVWYITNTYYLDANNKEKKFEMSYHVYFKVDEQNPVYIIDAEASYVKPNTIILSMLASSSIQTKHKKIIYVPHRVYEIWKFDENDGWYTEKPYNIYDGELYLEYV